MVSTPSEALDLSGPEGCVFCSISAGNADASLVYQNVGVLALLSLDQPTSHKVLVTPRQHVETIFDLEDDQARDLFQVAVRLARAIRTASGCSGLSLIQSNGRAAGQDVPHFHLHLVPRFEADKIRLEWPAARAPREELDQMAASIRSCMETQ